MLDKLHQERPCRLAGLCGQALAHKSVSGFSAPVRAPCCVAMVRVFFSLAAYDSARDFGLEICTHVQPAGARACPELFAGAGGPDEGHDQRASPVQARGRPQRFLLKGWDCIRVTCRNSFVSCFAWWASQSHTDGAVIPCVGVNSGHDQFSPPGRTPGEREAPAPRVAPDGERALSIYS